jgi:hypothetical protein
MNRAGFGLKAKGGDRHEETARVTYGGEASGLTPNVDSLIDRFTPNQTYLWTLFSGATHNRGWLVAGLEGDEAEILTSVLSPLLDTSDALVVEVARYFGLNPRPTVEKTHFHRVTLMRRARPSPNAIAGVDDYRAAGGAPPLPKP